MEISRQEYGSGLPFPMPGDLLDPGIEPVSLVSPELAGRFFTTALPGKPMYTHKHIHTMEYYSSIKQNEILQFAAKQMDLIRVLCLVK